MTQWLRQQSLFMAVIVFSMTFTFGFQRDANANSGLLVSLVMDQKTDSPVQVNLTSSVGNANSIQLLDNGEKPDVAAGDGRYAGAMLLAPGEYDVEVVLSDATYTGNTFEMPEDSDRTRICI